MRRSRWQFVWIALLAVLFYKLLDFVSPAAQGPAPHRSVDERTGENRADEAAPDAAGRASPREPALAEQIAAVARGESDSIRVLEAETTDADLTKIAALADLRRLNLGRGSFTDAGLAELVRLQKLELLRLSSPHLTDEALQSIAQLKSLRFLHLIHVPITDAGLKHLYDSKQLESFYLDGSRATDAGLEALLEALPKLHFHRDQLHLPGDKHAHDHDE